MQIGCFREVGTGFVGRIRTLTLDVGARLVPSGLEEHGKAPDWRVHLDDPADPEPLGIEIGSGWTHRRAGPGTYIKVQLDCPSFSRPVRANLLPSTQRDGDHVLLWSPRRRRPTAD